MQQRKARISIDPVLVIGTVLSVGLAVLFYANTDLAPAFATFAGLLGGITTLQVQTLLSQRRRAEHAGRMGQMVTMIETVPWMLDVLEPMLTAAVRVEEEYKKTPAVDALRVEFEETRRKLADLERGHFTTIYTDSSPELKLTRDMKKSMWVVSVPNIDLDWWMGPEGRQYWKYQASAIQKGVEVRRVFIYEEWPEALDTMAREQIAGGAQVRRIHRDRLPIEMRGIIGIWDATCGMELTYNADGEAIFSGFTVLGPDVERLQRQFELVERMAVGIDEPEPGMVSG